MYVVIGFHSETGKYQFWYFTTFKAAQSFKRTVTTMDDIVYMPILKEVE